MANRIIEVTRRGRSGVGFTGIIATAAISTNTQLATGDKGKAIICTAALTVSLQAAATLGDGWHCYIFAEGGNVTIDPNASETINGVSTQILPQGANAILICDGTKLYLFGPSGEGLTSLESQQISGNPTTIEFDNTNGLFNIVGDLQPDRIFINFRNVFPSVDGAELKFRVSTDNGATWLDQAGDYVLVNGSNILTAATFNEITCCTDVGNDAMEGIWRGNVVLYPDHSTHDKWIVEVSFLRVKSTTPGELLFFSGRGYINTTSPINAVQAYWDSGNFASGYCYAEKLFQLPSTFQ